MQGLRTQESAKFDRFFELIQKEAEKQGKIFFADAGDGNDFETETMEGEEMMGWLIPKEKAKEFEPMWKDSKVNDSWTDFFCWALWTLSENKIKIHFEG